MAFRSEKAARAFLAFALVVSPALLPAQDLRFEVRHHHLRKGGAGALTFTAAGLSFVEPEKPGHSRNWRWEDIQQLQMAPKVLRVLTYQDSKWKAGADKEFRFDIASGGSFEPAYEFLKRRLDQRLVAALADTDVQPLWELPVKHLKLFGGTGGVLSVGRDRIVFAADRPRESRTWRFSDIENVSTAGPFQLTITTYERAAMQYGDMRSFNFRLKRPLDERRYNELWRSLNEAKTFQPDSNYFERNQTE